MPVCEILEKELGYSVVIENNVNAFGEAYRMAKTQGDAQVFDEAIDLFARTIVNSITILVPNRVVLCGRLFQDEEIRERLIEQCKQYDAGCDEKRIIYSVLAEKEDYIGPVAAFVQEEIF